MSDRLAIIVPTRGRPENIERVIGAWDFTNAWDVADLILAVDGDDPAYQGYLDLFERHRHPDTGEPLFSMAVQDRWVPMVHKLNRVAVQLAEGRRYFALGFAGDDHLPRTMNWARRYLAVLRELGTGMVYGDDGYQGVKLSTEWAVTSDAVRKLGRMVPAPVEHMYCDNSMMDLYGGAGALRHLPEIRIEHMHPIAGKADTDAQYKRVNDRGQFRKDRTAYQDWLDKDSMRDVAAVRAMRAGRPVEALPGTVARQSRLSLGSGPRQVSRPTPRGNRPVSRHLPYPRHFRKVRGATPDEIGMTIADFATQVPRDQEIVELGVFQGRTALMMAWGARQGLGAHLTAIDAWDLPGNTYGPPFNEAGSETWARYNIQAQGYAAGVTLVKGFAGEVAEGWNGLPVGLLFVDDDHSHEGARRAVLSWAPHLAPGAIIAVDDYDHPDWPGVREALDELTAEGVVEPVEIFHDRLAVTRLTGAFATTLGAPSPAQPEEFPALVPIVEVNLPEPDSEVSTDQAPGLRVLVSSGELDGVAEGTEITALNTVQLRALAKVRGISLGTRKDKRDAMLQALEAGE